MSFFAIPNDLVVKLPVGHVNKIIKEAEQVEYRNVTYHGNNLEIPMVTFGRLRLILTCNQQEHNSQKLYYNFRRNRLGTFLTGSLRYGTYRSDSSDVDIVCRLRGGHIQQLEDIADHVYGGNRDLYSGIRNARSMKFGKLNIIACYNNACFQAWQNATMEAVQTIPSNKQETIEIFKRHVQQF